MLRLPTSSSAEREDGRLSISIATSGDRQRIYQARHEIYARELGQHAVNDERQLTDALDASNTYLVASVDGEMAGFISITSQVTNQLSIDKYVTRDQLPIPIDEHTFEIRLLTVLTAYRRTLVSALLMYGAFRFIDAHGGTSVIVMGRRQLRHMYTSTGLEPLGVDIASGAVRYELLGAPMDAVRRRLDTHSRLVQRLQGYDWDLPFRFDRPARCFHGGAAFFEEVGNHFEALDRRTSVVNADVLDAWFPPAPSVVAALTEHLPWLLSTSPPADSAGLLAVISEFRGVQPACLLAGAGSSALIFLAASRWLNPASRILLLDPTYGEYSHVLERVVQCHVDRLVLRRGENYDVNLDQLVAAAQDDYDLIVLVNPNSPSGRHIERQALEEALSRVPRRTRVWIDETYVEYVGAAESLEGFAARSTNVVVCKSMSKTYALSGARVAYLCGPPSALETLRAWTPPWAVGLPAQVAAVRALQDADYYQVRYTQTHGLRRELASDLTRVGLDVVAGTANFLLCHLPDGAPTAAAVVEQCRRSHVFLRDAGSMGSQLGERCLRVAVKDHHENVRITDAIQASMHAALS